MIIIIIDQNFKTNDNYCFIDIISLSVIIDIFLYQPVLIYKLRAHIVLTIINFQLQFIPGYQPLFFTLILPRWLKVHFVIIVRLIRIYRNGLEQPWVGTEKFDKIGVDRGKVMISRILTTRVGNSRVNIVITCRRPFYVIYYI